MAVGTVPAMGLTQSQKAAQSTSTMTLCIILASPRPAALSQEDYFHLVSSLHSLVLYSGECNTPSASCLENSRPEGCTPASRWLQIFYTASKCRNYTSYTQVDTRWDSGQRAVTRSWFGNSSPWKHGPAHITWSGGRLLLDPLHPSAQTLMSSERKRLTSQTHTFFTWYRPLCCLALWSGLPWDRCCVRMTPGSGWEVGSCPGKLSCGRGWICSPHLTAGTSGNHPWSWHCPSWLSDKQTENPTVKMRCHQVVLPPSPWCSPGDARGNTCSPGMRWKSRHGCSPDKDGTFSCLKMLLKPFPSTAFYDIYVAFYDTLLVLDNILKVSKTDLTSSVSRDLQHENLCLSISRFLCTNPEKLSDV